LIVEARDLDTDDRIVATLEVEMAADDAGQRAQLARAVAALHPDAQMRSFGEGAASFLGSQHLVVAHYRAKRGPALDAPGGRSRHVEQQPLFVA
jgi:hypothetical protein